MTRIHQTIADEPQRLRDTEEHRDIAEEKLQIDSSHHRTIEVEPQRHGDTEGHRDIAEEKPQIAQIDADRPHRTIAVLDADERGFEEISRIHRI